jgi:hypothetical protein
MDHHGRQHNCRPASCLSVLRASPVVLYCKPESGKKWKDVNCGSCQQGKSLYSSFIYRLKFDFGRFFRGLVNGFGRFFSGLVNGFGRFFSGLVNGFGMFCFGKTLKFGRMTFS